MKMLEPVGNEKNCWTCWKGCNIFGICCNILQRISNTSRTVSRKTPDVFRKLFASWKLPEENSWFLQNKFLQKVPGNFTGQRFHRRGRANTSLGRRGGERERLWCSSLPSPRLQRTLISKECNWNVEHTGFSYLFPRGDMSCLSSVSGPGLGLGKMRG